MTTRTRSFLALAALVAASTLAAPAMAQGRQAPPANPPTPAGAPSPGLAPSATAPAAIGQTFKVDPGHSAALFRIQHMGAGFVWGRFNAISGTFTTNEGKAEGMSFDISIESASIDTNNPDRDKHLKGPDFFNVKEFPTLSFKSTSVKKTGPSTFEVSGNLTMHGVTKPMTATVEATGDADKGMGRRAGVEATFTVDRSLFGMNYGVDKGMAGKDVKVVVALEGTPAK